jgi:hypothetical protein
MPSASKAAPFRSRSREANQNSWVPGKSPVTRSENVSLDPSMEWYGSLELCGAGKYSD